MKAEEYHYSLALSFIPNVGCVRAKQIIALLGSSEAFFREKTKNLRKIPGLSNHKLSRHQLDFSIHEAGRILSMAEKDGQKVFHYLESNYPRRLKQIDDAPLILFGKGNLDLNPKRSLGIVGTRNATFYGKQVTEDIIQAIAHKQISVVSGLALGIDGAAHKGCIQYNVPTIGILGHGLDMLYPHQHKILSEEMMDQGGLLSEFPNGTKPDACNFPMRNRIVAGMVDALVVVESDTQGGSLITCNLANDYGKDVFAVPGPIYSRYSRGCHKIIADNKAHIFSSTDEFLKQMAWIDDAKKQAVQLNLLQEMDENERVLFNFIKDKKQASMDALSVVLQMPIGQLNSLLLTMEIAGFLKSLPGKLYALSDRFVY